MGFLALGDLKEAMGELSYTSWAVQMIIIVTFLERVNVIQIGYMASSDMLTATIIMKCGLLKSTNQNKAGPFLTLLQNNNNFAFVINSTYIINQIQLSGYPERPSDMLDPVPNQATTYHYFLVLSMEPFT